MHLPNHRITAIPAAAFAIMLWSATFTATAADGSDIQALRAEIADLRARVEHLEKEISSGVAVNPARVVKPLPGGWKNEKNWKLLAKGMERERVEEILGEPDGARNVSKFEYWDYGQGKATFYLGRLKSWDRP
jgi:hypothetical protein